MARYHISVYAARAFPFIPDPKTDGRISLADLAAKLHVSKATAQKAVRWLKVQYPHYSLVSGKEGYRFSQDEGEIQECRERLYGANYAGIESTMTGVDMPVVRRKAKKKAALQAAWSTALGDLQVAIQTPLF